MEKRHAALTRPTKETDIHVEIDLDGSGKSEIGTGIPFFDHMLTLLARHGLFDLTVQATGDLSVDYHHTVEDTGIVLGQVIKEALGEKRGIRRYGFFYLPMDECLARVVMDLGNRPMLVYRVESTQTFVRDFNILLMREFFQALSNSLGANLHIELIYGDEPHHIAEAICKGFGRALDQATSLDERLGCELPTTKGIL